MLHSHPLAGAPGFANQLARLDGIEESWRRAYGVREADPIATTGVRSAGQAFADRAAMIFVKRNARWRGHLLASDIRFEAGSSARCRLLLFDEADKPLPGREDGGVIWFFDLGVAATGAINRTATQYRDRASTGLIGGIHKHSPYPQKRIEKERALAETVAPGTFISADSVDVTAMPDGRRLLAVANQGLNRLELFDLDQLLAVLGVGAVERQKLYGR